MRCQFYALKSVSLTALVGRDQSRAREHYSALKLPSNTVLGLIPNFDLLMLGGFSSLGLALAVVNVCARPWHIRSRRSSGRSGTVGNARRQLFILVGNINCR
jgi:hypothetical protein